MTGARWVLGLDIGTGWAAGAAGSDGGVERLEVAGEHRVPCTVVLTEDGRLLAGSYAHRAAGRLPDRAESNPRRYVGRAPMLLGGQPVAAADALAALVALFVAEGRRRHDDREPDRVALTHPAGWPADRLAALRAVAERVLPGVEVLLVPEPVAVAVAAGERSGPVAVFDLGTTSLDTTVVVPEPGGFAVAGRPGGDPDLGGEVFDQHVFGHFGAQLAHVAPEWWRRVGTDPDRSWLAAAADLQEEARRARESLSDSETADRYVAGADADVRISRAELDGLIGDDVRRAVRMLGDTVDAAGGAVRAVLLSGGATRTPLVQHLLRERWGDLVRPDADPKSLAAMGAARLALGTAARAAPVPGRAPDAAGHRVVAGSPGPPATAAGGPDLGRPGAVAGDQPSAAARIGDRAAGGGAVGGGAVGSVADLPPSWPPPGAEEHRAGGRGGPAPRHPAPRSGGMVVLDDGVLDARVVSGRVYSWSAVDGGGHRIARIDPRTGRADREVRLGRLVGWAVSAAGLLVCERRGADLVCHTLGPDLTFGASVPLPTPYRPHLAVEGAVGWAVLRSPDTRLADGPGTAEVGSLAVQVFPLGGVPGPLLPLGPSVYRYTDPDRRLLDPAAAGSGVAGPFGDGRSCALVIGRPDAARQLLCLIGPGGEVTRVAERPSGPWVGQVRGGAGRWLLATAAGLETYADLRRGTDRRLLLPRPASGAVQWVLAGGQAFGLVVERLDGQGCALHLLAGGRARDLGRWAALVGSPVAARSGDATRARSEGDVLLLGVGDGGGRSAIVRAGPAGVRELASAPGRLEPMGTVDGAVLARHLPDATPAADGETPGTLVHLTP